MTVPDTAADRVGSDRAPAVSGDEDARDRLARTSAGVGLSSDSGS